MLSGATPIAFTLPVQMTAETADALAESLLQLPLTQTPSLTLDASQVEIFSTSGAQVLVALEKTILAAEGELIITGQKPFLAHAFSELGLGWLTGHLR